MKCSLLDVQCHALSWLSSLPWYVYALALLAVGLLVWVLYDKISGIILGIIRWGGWRAGVAALLALIAVLAAIWPKRHVTTEEQYSSPDPLHPRKGKERNKGKEWERRPGENAAEWQERLNRKN